MDSPVVVTPDPGRARLGTSLYHDMRNDLDRQVLQVPVGGLLLACLIGISLWNASEIILVTYLTYCRLRTLYFWSILASATGVVICTLSQVINIGVVGRSDLLPAILGALGWVPMVTGQSLVLYSRLHMLYVDTRILRLALTMIIVNAVTLHVVGITLVIGSNSSSQNPYIYAYNVFERLQITIFFIQEAFLSGLYLWASHKFIKKYAHRLEHSRDDNMHAVNSTLRTLIIVNFIFILLDIAVLVLQYLGFYIFQLSGKNFVYSVKLKLELGVLNQLRDFVKRTRGFDTNLQIREQQRQRHHVEIQWEAALRRAVGTITRSRARTRLSDPDCETQAPRSPGVAALGSCRSRASRDSGAVDHPEFFNVEIVISTSNEQSYLETQEDSKRGGSAGDDYH